MIYYYLMKLILLRHEERHENPLFFTSLVEDGFKRAENELPKKINDLKPDVIYCSPFRRTIQTIRPYCIKYNKKINIEYSLYEYIHAIEFTEENFKHDVSELNKNEYIDIINTYTSYISLNELVYPEDEIKIKKRIFNFINKLKKIHKDKTVLLVSHMSVLNMCKKYYDNKTELEDELKMGSLTILV